VKSKDLVLSIFLVPLFLKVSVLNSQAVEPLPELAGIENKEVKLQTIPKPVIEVAKSMQRQYLLERQDPVVRAAQVNGSVEYGVYRKGGHNYLIRRSTDGSIIINRTSPEKGGIEHSIAKGVNYTIHPNWFMHYLSRSDQNGIVNFGEGTRLGYIVPFGLADKNGKLLPESQQPKTPTLASHTKPLNPRGESKVSLDAPSNSCIRLDMQEARDVYIRLYKLMLRNWQYQMTNPDDPRIIPFILRRVD
jgi:hypothetical protein